MKRLILISILVLLVTGLNYCSKDEDEGIAVCQDLYTKWNACATAAGLDMLMDANALAECKAGKMHVNETTIATITESKINCVIALIPAQCTSANFMTMLSQLSICIPEFGNQ